MQYAWSQQIDNFIVVICVLSDMIPKTHAKKLSIIKRNAPKSKYWQSFGHKYSLW